jgi:mRNA interferase RelE/StbE
MWKVVYLKDALEDLKKLDRSRQLQVVKKINQVALNPLPLNEGGYGEPLGNFAAVRLSGFCKIKLRNLGLRVVYRLEVKSNEMMIIVVSARADNEVYLIAKKRKGLEGVQQ